MKLYRIAKDNENGFTLIEIMITISITVVALLGFMAANSAIQRSSEAAHQRTIAIQDANRVLEDMRNAALTGTFPGNVTAVYPDETNVSGFTNLNSEQILVSYTDPSAEPLDVTVTVSWTDNNNRSVTSSLRTFITQRT